MVFPAAHFGEGIIELDPWSWNLFEHQITCRIWWLLQEISPRKTQTPRTESCSFRPFVGLGILSSGPGQDRRKTKITSGPSSPGVCGSRVGTARQPCSCGLLLKGWVCWLWALSQQLFLALLYMARGGMWGYRWGRGARRLRAGFGRLLCLDYLPLRPENWNFQPEQQAEGEREGLCLQEWLGQPWRCQVKSLYKSNIPIFWPWSATKNTFESWYTHKQMFRYTKYRYIISNWTNISGINTLISFSMKHSDIFYSVLFYSFLSFKMQVMTH